MFLAHWATVKLVDGGHNGCQHGAHSTIREPAARADLDREFSRIDMDKKPGFTLKGVEDKRLTSRELNPISVNIRLYQHVNLRDDQPARYSEQLKVVFEVAALSEPVRLQSDREARRNCFMWTYIREAPGSRRLKFVHIPVTIGQDLPHEPNLRHINITPGQSEPFDYELIHEGSPVICNHQLSYISHTLKSNAGETLVGLNVADHKAFLLKMCAANPNKFSFLVNSFKQDAAGAMLITGRVPPDMQPI